MKDYQAASEPIWPYIGVVSCLFVLSIVAARSWEANSKSFRIPASAVLIPPKVAEPVTRLGADAWLEAGGGSATRSATAPILRSGGLSNPREGAPNRLADTSSHPAVGQSAPPEARKALPERELPMVEPDRVAENASAPGQDTQRPPAKTALDSGPALVSSVPPQRLDAETSRSIEIQDVPSLGARVEFAPPVANQVDLEPQPQTQTPADPGLNGKRQQRPDTGDRAPTSTRQAGTHQRQRSSAEEKLPAALADWLDVLIAEPATQSWAEAIRTSMTELSELNQRSAGESEELFSRLKQLSQEARLLAETIDSNATRSILLRASYAVEKRRLVWEHVLRITSKSGHGFVSVGAHDLEDVLAKVEEYLGTTSKGLRWRKYLRLAELRSANAEADSATQRELARRVLVRMKSRQWLAQDQLAYLAGVPFSELSEGLKRWAREPVDYDRLPKVVEKYESRRGSAAAAELAKTIRIARWSRSPDERTFAKVLDTRYRNANLRVAVKSDAINRLLPQRQTTEVEVDEYILGAYVSGMSKTSSDLRVVLIPDNRLWRMRLEAHGAVQTSTAASKGPATFYNDGHSEFTASKLLLVNESGVTVKSAEADADSASELTGMRTQFDAVPVVGALARAIARQQHDGRSYDAQLATEARLEERAREKLDEEVHRHLNQIEQQFRDTVLEPFQKLRLSPTVLDMKTTDQRLVIRYRLATSGQLGAHTPRPQAPADSLLSVQIHETALNNMIEQLELNGRSHDLREMYSRLSSRFGPKETEVPDDIPHDVTIKFAQREPIRMQLDEGRLALTVRIAELRNHRTKWRNFAVRVYYVPDPQQHEANLRRDGVVELAGARLRLGDQIALRGIFSKVFSKNTPVNIINKRLSEHHKMKDLQVTQLVITDGWIGIAVAPQRMAQVARRPGQRR